MARRKKPVRKPVKYRGKVVRARPGMMIELPIEIGEQLGDGWKPIPCRVTIKGIDFHAPVRPVIEEAEFYEPDEPLVITGYYLYLYVEMREILEPKIGSRLDITFVRENYKPSRKGRRVR